MAIRLRFLLPCYPPRVASSEVEGGDITRITDAQDLVVAEEKTEAVFFFEKAMEGQFGGGGGMVG